MWFAEEIMAAKLHRERNLIARNVEAANKLTENGLNLSRCITKDTDWVSGFHIQLDKLGRPARQILGVIHKTLGKLRRHSLTPTKQQLNGKQVMVTLEATEYPGVKVSYITKMPASAKARLVKVKTTKIMFRPEGENNVEAQEDYFEEVGGHSEGNQEGNAEATTTGENSDAQNQVQQEAGA